MTAAKEKPPWSGRTQGRKRPLADAGGWERAEIPFAPGEAKTHQGAAIGRYRRGFKRKFCADLFKRYQRVLHRGQERADVLAITTAWLMFGDVKERANEPVADCRFML